VVQAQQTPAKKSGDWSSRLLSITKKKKKHSSEDVFLPRRPSAEAEFEEDEAEEDEGPSEKRLPAEMR
jgi:hypothetical protein